LIENFRENRLIKLLVFCVGLFSVAYLGVALLLMYVPEDNDSKLYLLPTIDTASFTEGTSMEHA